MKTAIIILCSIASLADAQTDSNYYYCRRVNGVIYNPHLSKLWVSLPLETHTADAGQFTYEKYTVSSVKTNGVIFSVEKTIFYPQSMGSDEQSGGYVFVKNIPHLETYYTDQKLEGKILALPIKNMDFQTVLGKTMTVRAYDCGEPCPPPALPIKTPPVVAPNLATNSSAH